MRDVTVDIITATGQDSISIYCDGKLKESGGKYSVKAQSDDAVFFFEYDRNEKLFAAHRRGGMDYDARFKDGEVFAANLTTPFGQVKTQCKTLRTAFDELDGGYAFRAEYELCGERHNLTVSIRDK